MKSVSSISDDDLLFYSMVLKFVSNEVLLEDDMRLVRAIELEDQRRLRKARVRREGRRFNQEIDDFTESRFRRYFRMPRVAFATFCATIIDAVGADVFKPESSFDPVEQEGDRRRHGGAIDTCGGPMSGEVRVAIFLRLLAGASYLDLMVIFQVTHDPVYRSFRMVSEWVNTSFHFPLVAALENGNLDYFKSVASSFAMGTSRGHFNGCIGALDGIAIRIRRPTLSRDLRDPGAYFCRKNFHALNCQAICDSHKRISWLSSRHIGSCHDSVAFTDTRLYDLLQKKRVFLETEGFFIVGDSAYNIESFLLTPYDHAEPRSIEDSYNFYHSSCRIRIECAFGEIVMRFGILWRSLKFDISFVGEIISAACLVHNFIVDLREGEDLPGPGYVSPTTGFAPDVPTTLFPIVTDNNEPKPSGRPKNSVADSKEKGVRLRDTLAIVLDNEGLKRPLQTGCKYNQYGMIYMEY
jgi:hypothetical protein